MNKERGKVDLRICEPGDTLISVHGMKLEYVRKLPEEYYMDHEIKYPDGSHGSRSDDGYAYRKMRLETDHDIVEIIKAGER